MSSCALPELGTAIPASRATAGSVGWLLLVVPGLIWGASFLFIAEGLRAVGPNGLTFVRILVGFATLSLLPSARRPVARADLGAVALLGVLWFAFPLSMFPLAEQRVCSALTGMLNGANPLFTAIVAAILARRLPSRGLTAGLAVGLAGAALVAWPTIHEGRNSAVGVLLILAALASYGFALNLARPLQQRNGAEPVIWRAQAVALVLTAPLGLPDVLAAHWTLGPLLALAALGTLGTGLAYVLLAMAAGRFGATRASATTFLIPAVALVLGILVRSERVALLSVVGAAVCVSGAWLARRAQADPTRASRSFSFAPGMKGDCPRVRAVDCRRRSPVKLRVRIPMLLAACLASAPLALAQEPTKAPSPTANPAPPTMDDLRFIRMKIAAADLYSAESILEVHHADKGEDAEYLLGLAWLARGAALTGDWTAASRYAKASRDLAVTKLGTPADYANNREATYALGTSIEVEAQALVAAGRKAEAIRFLDESSKAQATAPYNLRARIWKRRNQIELVGQKAPDFHAEDHAGGESSGLAALCGRPVVLFFWWESCGDCKAQAAALRRAVETYEPKGVVFLAPTRFYDEDHAAEKAKIENAWRQIYALPDSVAVPISDEAMVRYGVSATPTFVFLDRKGVVRQHLPYRMTYERLSAAIDDLLK